MVYVLDDDPRVRRALGRLLRTAGRTVELFAELYEELLRSLAEGRPGCLVSDLRLPEVHGLDLFAMLRMAGHRLPIVFITGYGDVPTSVKLHEVSSGAVDFLIKPVDEDELLVAVGRALRRDARTRTLVAEIHAVRERFALLTPREREVFALVVKGNLNKQIAGRLGTTEQTVKVHRGRVMQKMGAASLAHLVHLSERLSRGADRSPSGRGRNRSAVPGAGVPRANVRSLRPVVTLLPEPLTQVRTMSAGPSSTSRT